MENNFKPKKLNKAELAVHLDKVRRKRFETDKKTTQKTIIFLFISIVAEVIFIGYILYNNKNPNWLGISMLHALYGFNFLKPFWSDLLNFRGEKYTYTPPTEEIIERPQETLRPKQRHFIWTVLKKIGWALHSVFEFLFLCMWVASIAVSLLMSFMVFATFDSRPDSMQGILVCALLWACSFIMIIIYIHNRSVIRAKRGLPPTTGNNKYINQFVKFASDRGNLTYIAIIFLIFAYLTAYAFPLN